jgi:lipoate-protein ligase A
MWVEQDTSLGVEADLAYSTTLLRAVQHGTITEPIVRLYRPEPTVSFGQQDVRMAGYEVAQEMSRQHGFIPTVRKVGGRAAAYHRGSLVIDHIQPEQDAMFGFRERFEYFGELFTSMLGRLGVKAAVGEIPGEYCAGEYSVHAVLDSKHRIKLAGTAQRVVKGAWLFSTSLVVEEAAPVRAVLTDVYRALDLPLDPTTVGAVEDAAPGVTVEDVIDELQLSYAQEFFSETAVDDAASQLVETSWSTLRSSVPPGEDQ